MINAATSNNENGKNHKIPATIITNNNKFNKIDIYLCLHHILFHHNNKVISMTTSFSFVFLVCFVADSFVNPLLHP